MKTTQREERRARRSRRPQRPKRERVSKALARVNPQLAGREVERYVRWTARPEVGE